MELLWKDVLIMNTTTIFVFHLWTERSPVGLHSISRLYNNTRHGVKNFCSTNAHLNAQTESRSAWMLLNLFIYDWLPSWMYVFDNLCEQNLPKNVHMYANVHICGRIKCTHVRSLAHRLASSCTTCHTSRKQRSYQLVNRVSRIYKYFWFCDLPDL